jgi:hypothetical protein
MTKTPLEQHRTVKVNFTIQERMVILRACLWFERNVTRGGFLSVFALEFARLMTESSAHLTRALAVDMTLLDFLGSVMTQYEENANPPLIEIPHIGTVIDKCQPIIEETIEVTTSVTVIELIKQG